MSEAEKPWTADEVTCRNALEDFGARLVAAREFAKTHHWADELGCYRRMADEAADWMKLLKDATA